MDEVENTCPECVVLYLVIFRVFTSKTEKLCSYPITILPTPSKEIDDTKSEGKPELLFLKVVNLPERGFKICNPPPRVAIMILPSSSVSKAQTLSQESEFGFPVAR